MSDFTWVFLLILAVVLGNVMGNIAKQIGRLSDAYKARSDWLARQADLRSELARQRQRERDEECNRRYWQGLWETLQRLQQEYLALELKEFVDVDGVVKYVHARRLAARIALLWIQFLEQYDRALPLEGYPEQAGTDDFLIRDYVERYALAAGTIIKGIGHRRDSQKWVYLVAACLHRRLLVLNTPGTSTPPTESAES